MFIRFLQTGGLCSSPRPESSGRGWVLWSSSFAGHAASGGRAQTVPPPAFSRAALYFCFSNKFCSARMPQRIGINTASNMIRKEDISFSTPRQFSGSCFIVGVRRFGPSHSWPLPVQQFLNRQNDEAGNCGRQNVSCELFSGLRRRSTPTAFFLPILPPGPLALFMFFSSRLVTPDANTVSAGRQYDGNRFCRGQPLGLLSFTYFPQCGIIILE